MQQTSVQLVSVNVPRRKSWQTHSNMTTLENGDEWHDLQWPVYLCGAPNGGDEARSRVRQGVERVCQSHIAPTCDSSIIASAVESTDSTAS